MKFLLFLLFFTINAQALEKVSIQLQWLDQFQFAGYYVAKERGFYSDVGLDVEIKKFQYNMIVVDEVNEKRATYGVGRSSLIIDITNGSKIKLLSAIFQSSPLVLIAKQDSNISSIQDFVGKRIMITSDAHSAVSLYAMQNKFNITRKDLIEQEHTFNIEDLINSKTDLMASYLSNEPYLLDKQGIKINIFDPKEYGFDFYSDILFTSEYELHNHSQRAINMRDASLKGWEYAFENIEETVDLILQKYNVQNKSKEALLFEAKALKRLAYYHTDKLGQLQKSKIQRIYDIYNVMGIVENSVDIDSFIDSLDSEIKFTKEEKEYLKNKKSLSVCVKEEWLPYEDIQNGKFVGISADFLNLFASKLFLDLKIIKSKTQLESLLLLEKGKCDIKPIMGRKSSEFIPYLPTDKILNDNIVLVTQLQQPFIDNLSNLNESVVMVNGLHKFLKKVIYTKYKN